MVQTKEGRTQPIRNVHEEAMRGSRFDQQKLKCPENKRKEMFQSLSDAMETPAKRQKSFPAIPQNNDSTLQEIQQN